MPYVEHQPGHRPPSVPAPRHAVFRDVPPCDGDLDGLSGLLTIARENRLLVVSIPASPTICIPGSGVRSSRGPDP